MLVNSDELSKALDRISAVASLDKEAPGVLFNITNDCIGIYYHSSQKAIRDIIPATIEDPSEVRQIVFEYKRLTDIIGYCKSSGDIRVDNIEFKFTTNPDGSGKAIIKAVKKIVYNGDVENAEIASVYNQELSWWDIGSVDNRRKILGRECCPDMYNSVGATTWEASELRRVMSEVTNDDGKVVYMTPKYNGAFSVNTNSVVFVKANCEVQQVMHLPSNFAKALISVLNGVSDDTTVYSNIIADETGALQACIFFTEDKVVSVYFGAAAKVGTHLTAMGRYSGFEYKSHQVTIMTSIIKDVIKAAVNLNSQTKGDIKFVKDGDSVKAVITAINSGASVSNEYEVVCNKYRTNIDNEEATEDETLFTISLDLKLLLDILSSCKEEFIGFDTTVNDAGIFLRLGFIDMTASAEVTSRRVSELGLSEPSQLDNSEVLSIREQYINTCYYVVVKSN